MKNLKRINLGFLVVFGFLFCIFGVFADTKEDLEKFKEKEYDLIFESNLSSSGSEYSKIFNVSNKVNIFSDLTDRAKTKRLDAQGDVDYMINRISSLENTLKALDEDIAESMKKIADTNVSITEARKRITENEKVMKILKEKIEKNKQILLEYLDYLYKKQNTSYDSGEIDNIKSILLNNEDISDLLNDLYFNSIIQVAGKKLIEQYQEDILQLYLKKVSLEKERNNLSIYRKELIIAQKDLSDKKKFKETLLEASKGKQEDYKKYLDKKLEIENNLRVLSIKEKIKFDKLKDDILKKYNCRFVDMSKNTTESRSLKNTSPECYRVNKMIYSESKLGQEGILKEDITDRNIMNWPINPYRGISAYFHDKGYKAEFGSEHNAIDIVAKQGTPIQAPMSGYVVYVQKPESQDYSFLALKHANGYITVYGHLSKVLVDQYDYVEKGGVFAETGGEFGTFGAGYITTGPHLHFEIFKNEKYTDPLGVLDLSYLNYKLLPSEYKLKYLFDFKNRKGYEYKNKDSNTKTFRLEGETEVARQKYFLSHYANSAFSDWNVWMKAGVNGNIDPSLLICIGLAESGLGSNLTTRFNIGNVGNNDRGDRVGYDSALEGINAVVRTLNNRYFSSVNRLDALSGAGRKKSSLASCKVQGEFCYASDTNHWHRNVVTCMSHLKGYMVPDDYNFRIIN